MLNAAKRLAYFDFGIHKVAWERLEKEPDIELLRLLPNMDLDPVWPKMAKIHGFQMASDRSELPDALFGNRVLLERCPELLVLSVHGAGYDIVDVDACTEAGVLVVNQAGGNKEPVAEHALGMMLCLSKRIREADQALRRDRNWHRNDFMGHDLRGQTLGIVGLGNIGTRLAQLCRTLFEMRVIAYDPYISDADFAERGAERATRLDDLMRQADFVSINCPRNDETRGMIGADEYAAMKPTAYLINTARGGIHDEAALVAALRNGELAGAGLDVWDKEPPPLDHPLLQMDNVIGSPHTAGVTHEGRHSIASFAADQWKVIFAGRRPPRLINPDAWPKYTTRFERAFGVPVRE